MALLRCTGCGKDFYGLQCPTCGATGKPIQSASPLPLLLLLGMIAAFTLSWRFVFPPSENTPASSQTPHKLAPDNEAILADYTSRHLIRIDTRQRKAWVSPDFWIVLDASKKESLVELMAAKCASENADQMASIDVFDMQSATRIAEFGPFSGFKVY
jgi:hypothetical protein